MNSVVLDSVTLVNHQGSRLWLTRAQCLPSGYYAKSHYSLPVLDGIRGTVLLSGSKMPADRPTQIFKVHSPESVLGEIHHGKIAAAKHQSSKRKRSHKDHWSVISTCESSLEESDKEVSCETRPSVDHRFTLIQCRFDGVIMATRSAAAIALHWEATHHSRRRGAALVRVTYSVFGIRVHHSSSLHRKDDW